MPVTEDDGCGNVWSGVELRCGSAADETGTAGAGDMVDSGVVMGAGGDVMTDGGGKGDVMTDGGGEGEDRAVAVERGRGTRGVTVDGSGGWEVGVGVGGDPSSPVARGACPFPPPLALALSFGGLGFAVGITSVGSSVFAPDLVCTPATNAAASGLGRNVIRTVHVLRHDPASPWNPPVPPSPAAGGQLLLLTCRQSLPSSASFFTIAFISRASSALPCFVTYAQASDAGYAQRLRASPTTFFSPG